MTPAAFPATRRPLYKSLFAQVLAGLILGVALGMAAPEFAVSLKFLSDAFLKLISMIVAPVVFCVVVHGIAGAGDLKKVGRVGIKALAYFEAMTTVALAVGLIVAHLIRPGEGMNIDATKLDPHALSAYVDNAHKLHGGGFSGFILNIIPSTAFDAFARNDVLQVLFFAIIFGVSLALVGEPAKPLTDLIEIIAKVLFRAMGLIVRLAPLGVLGAVAYTVGEYGVGSLKQLASLVVVFWLSIAFFVLVVLGAVMRFFTGLSILPFLNYFREELTIVLATASSDAVLPQIMRKLERMGADPSVVGARRADRLFVQPRRLLDLPHARNRVHCSGDQHAALFWRPSPDPRYFAHHLEGSSRRAGLGDRDSRRDAERGSIDPGDWACARLVDRLVRRHGARARQPDRQLCCDCRDRCMGRRPRRGARQGGSLRPGCGRPGRRHRDRRCSRGLIIRGVAAPPLCSKRVRQGRLRHAVIFAFHARAHRFRPHLNLLRLTDKNSPHG
jgi:Na+/H+-dicarboxylate symporter